MKYDQKTEDKLLAFFDQEGSDFHRQGNRDGEEESVQGELYRKYYRIMHEKEGNGSGNWDSDKCELNKKGYSVEYLIDLVQKYLDDNPDGFMAKLQLRVDSEKIIFDRADTKYKETIFKDYGNGKRNKEYYKIEFLNNFSKCTSAADIFSLTSNFGEIWESLDFSKCTNTQEQLDSVSIWDEDLNWLIGHLTDNALPEWSDEYIDKLRNSLELLRPKVPIGVVNSESNDEWHRQNNKQRFSDARAYDNAQEFIEKSIFSWIYQNPDLIDLKGKSLEKSIKEFF